MKEGKQRREVPIEIEGERNERIRKRKIGVAGVGALGLAVLCYFGSKTELYKEAKFAVLWNLAGFSNYVKRSFSKPESSELKEPKEPEETFGSQYEDEFTDINIFVDRFRAGQASGIEDATNAYELALAQEHLYKQFSQKPPKVAPPNRSYPSYAYWVGYRSGWEIMRNLDNEKYLEPLPEVDVREVTKWRKLKEGK